VSVTSALGTVQRDVAVENDTNIAIAYTVPGLKTIASVNANANFNVTPASVTHVNPMQLAMEGQTSWRKVLEQIPGVAVTAFVAAQNSIPDSPRQSIYFTINGSLPYETATLLDDMPLIGATTGGFGSGVGGGTGTDLSLYGLNGFSG